LVYQKEASLRILLTCIGLAWAATALLVSYAERQQEAALERLSSYKLKSQPVLDDDLDLKLVTARPPIRDER
jgi:hypothetical protein